MKLYDNAGSPYAFKVRGVLYEKGLTVEHHEIVSEHQRDELLLVSPRGEAPFTGTLKGDDIAFALTINAQGQTLQLDYSGKVTGDTMGERSRTFLETTALPVLPKPFTRDQLAERVAESMGLTR